MDSRVHVKIRKHCEGSEPKSNEEKYIQDSKKEPKAKLRFNNRDSQ